MTNWQQGTQINRKKLAKLYHKKNSTGTSASLDCFRSRKMLSMQFSSALTENTKTFFPLNTFSTQHFQSYYLVFKIQPKNNTKPAPPLCMDDCCFSILPTPSCCAFRHHLQGKTSQVKAVGSRRQGPWNSGSNTYCFTHSLRLSFFLGFFFWKQELELICPRSLTEKDLLFNHSCSS